MRENLPLLLYRPFGPYRFGQHFAQGSSSIEVLSLEAFDSFGIISHDYS